MNVLAFVASPRKNSNTDILTDRFLEGAKSTGADCEKVYLYDCSINFCQGCYRNCWINPNDCTRFEDDMQRLIEKMIASDLVLFASPVYMGSFTAKLLSFFERTIPIHNVDLETMVVVENRLRGRNAVVALIHDSPDPATAELPFKVMDRILKKSFEMNIVGRLQVGGVRDKADINNKQESLREAYELAVRLCSQ